MLYICNYELIELSHLPTLQVYPLCWGRLEMSNEKNIQKMKALWTYQVIRNQPHQLCLSQCWDHLETLNEEKIEKGKEVRTKKSGASST